MPKVRENYDNKLTTKIGKNIRAYRRIAGLTLSDVAKQAGVSTQQMQKYETGANRISAEFIYDVARMLNVNVECLFREPEELKENPKSVDSTDAHKTLAMIKAYSRINDPAIREQILTLVQSLGQQDKATN